jgi:DNA ligase-1
MNMDQPWQVISALETHNLRTNKEQIIQAQAEAGNSEFFEGCRLALDPMITFGIKQVPEKKATDQLTSDHGMNWDTFALAITGFVNRQITGNMARDMLNHMMLASTQEQWNGWYRRILIKDLRCGVSEKTINKVVDRDYPGYSVPVFGCQLAHDSANHEGKVTGKKLVEVKLDGVRVITIVYPDGRVDQFSRNGKELVNFGHVKAEFHAIADQLSEAMVFDGEIMSASFQDLMRQVHRKSNVRATDAVLHLFDCLPLADFEQGRSLATQIERSHALKAFYQQHEAVLPSVRVLGQELVDLDTEAGQARYREINREAIAGGYEGIMIKDTAAAYECKRSVAWLKLKPFIEVSLNIVDVEAGTGKNTGRLGALVCEGEDDGRRIRVNVGSGYSDELRTGIWDSQHTIKGQVIEVRADAVTQNQDGSYSLRFPRFLRFRGFEIGEKL